MLSIYPIQAFQDNYIWALVDPKTQQMAVVDPGDSHPVFDFMDQHQLQLCAILITHHHHDHTGGIKSLVNHHSVPVYGPDSASINDCNHPVTGGEHICIEPLDQTFKILSIPGHTLDHIGYYAHGMLFCGDTLFSGGCGRLFEGTPQQMYTSLQKLINLPPDTKVYCAHEYTIKNLQFAATVEPHNLAIRKRIEQVLSLRSKDIASLPSTMHIECATNPFLRTDQPAVITAANTHANKKLTNPVDVFATLRAWKDTV